MKDFPQEALELFGIEAKHPDEFLLDLCENFSLSILAKIIREQASDLKNPPNTFIDTLAKLSHQVPIFTSKILCHEYGCYIIKIAQEILKIMGKKLSSGEIVYKGKQYYIQQSNNELVIVDEQNRGEILRILRTGKVIGTLQVEDIKTFESAAQIMQRKA